MQVQSKLFKHSFPYTTVVLLQYFYDKLFCEDKQKQNPHTLQTTPPLKKKDEFTSVTSTQKGEIYAWRHCFNIQRGLPGLKRPRYCLAMP